MIDDSTRCYRHSDTNAAVACQRCERPICPQCMTQASVGFHCPECLQSGAQQVVRGRDIQARQQRPVTIGLMVASVVAFFTQSTVIGDPPLPVELWGLLYGPAVEAGEWWRLVTSGFLHADPIHLGMNMFALWIFGPPLERMLGAGRFLLTYLTGLIGGGAAVVLFAFESPTLGASGAVLGLAGALAAVLWSRGIAITQTSLGGIFVINLLLPLLVPRISFWGHFGGIAAGFGAGWLLTWLPTRFRQPQGVAIGATVALCVVLAGVSVLVAPLSL